MLDPRSGRRGRDDRQRSDSTLKRIGALAALLLILVPLQEAGPDDPAIEYQQARGQLLRGNLEKSQAEADSGYRRYRFLDPVWASKFLLLETDSLESRGMSQDALALLATWSPGGQPREDIVHESALEAVALTRVRRFAEASHAIARGAQLCELAPCSACGEIVRARGILATEQGDLSSARKAFNESLQFARQHNDNELEATALLNLGVVALRQERYDEALDWSTSAYKAALALGNEDRAQGVVGNLGWAYYELGDLDRASTLFAEAEERATRIGNVRAELNWLTTSGSVYQTQGVFPQADELYRRALALARDLQSEEDILNSLETLAHVSIEEGKLDDAENYLRQLEPLIRANGNRLDALDVTLARGRIAAARRQDAEAERLFLQVESDPSSQITMKLGAEHELARLYETEGRPEDAQQEYVTALATFETARADIGNEASKLPYFQNATPIYDDYIRLLISQGKTDEALTAADQSRARTLEQGLGLTVGASSKDVARPPGAIASRAGATLLFYWLGEKQSWLWAITPQKTAVFPLPAKAEIAHTVERYRLELLGPEDPLKAGNEDGRALYRTLVAPAKDLIAPGGRVVILCDGVLSELNFETLLVDGATPHYWIEDADVVSAPSLLMLAAAKPSQNAGGRLLLVGDAISPGPDYPELPNAPVEMREIRKHFPPQDATVLTRRDANAAAYLHSDPRRFSYIDFVAHGVASRADPLDSAIILSRTTGGEDSFRLYAREIMQHPLDARLVTIAACYGGGTRSYAGEGLVGLSWAFLRAGAHNVIGALWEVSDASAPRLMDALYQGLQDGLPPNAALRQAKLKLLHASPQFRRPFFWGSFQLYTGM